MGKILKNKNNKFAYYFKGHVKKVPFKNDKEDLDKLQKILNKAKSNISWQFVYI